MRLMPALTLGIALALAMTILTVSGISSEFGQQSETQIESEFDEQAEATDEAEYDPDDGGGGLLGSAIAAIDTVQSLGSVMLYMPSTLVGLGMPSEYARPLGHTLQIVFVLGVAQILRGFVIQ